jgi:hypothetical protein
MMFVDSSILLQKPPLVDIEHRHKDKQVKSHYNPTKIVKTGRSIFLMATKLLHMTSLLTLLHFCPDLLGKVLQDVDEIRVLR